MKTAIGSALVALAWLAAASPAATGEQGYIGVQIKKNDNGDGILVVMAIATSPADMAGVRGTDVIVKLNGKKVEELNDFVQAIRDTKPGETVVLAILRNEKEVEIKVKVGNLPKDNL